MLLRELFEAPAKRAVLAFGRLNPPTVGHAKLVDKLTSIDGDHFLFLSQTQKPKTDPLDFATKMKFAKQFFPGVNVGHQSVRTPVQALEFLQSLGYTDVVFIAGSDRVDGFQKLFDTYNGQPDKTGKVPFKFNSIKVVSAGERDPDADDVSGMSASKMRALAAQGELESFAQGVPDKKLAKTMYDAVRKGMGVKDAVAAEDASGEEEDEFHRKLDKLVHKTFGHSSDEKKKEKKKKTDEKIDTSKASKIDLKKAISTLEPRQQEVIKMRFEHNMTFAAIGKELGVSPDRARQILQRILRQLRHPVRGVTEPEDLPKISANVNADFKGER